MDQDLYDQFGHYIGPTANQSDPGSNQEQDSKLIDLSESSHFIQAQHQQQQPPVTQSITQQIVLHQDKRYYRDASQVYHPDVQTLIQQQDTQPLSKPIIESTKQKNFFATQKYQTPKCNFDFNYLSSNLLSKPQRIRNIAIVGHLHHGKTVICDMFVNAIHKNMKVSRYTDTRNDELLRKISMKLVPLQLMMESSSGKSYALNIIDTPGHPNFEDQVNVAFRLVDGVAVVIDVIEGVMMETERVLKEAVRLQLGVVIILNKLDRLVVELRLPPNDAYHKIRHTLEKVNFIMKSAGWGEENIISPTVGNVVFACGELGGLFTLESWAKMHLEINLQREKLHRRDKDQEQDEQKFLYGLDPQNPDQHQSYRKDTSISRQLISSFASKLWGDLYFNQQTKKFYKKPPSPQTPRSFVYFILQPLYKVIGYTIGQQQTELRKTLVKLNVYLNKRDFKLDIRPLLKLVMTKWLGNLAPLIDSLTTFIPSPCQSSQPLRILKHFYNPSTPQSAQAARLYLKQCNPKNPLYVHIAKLIPKPDCSTFDALGRVISGTLRQNDKVCVMGEDYTNQENQDMVIKQVEALYLSMARYKVKLQQASAGSIVLIEGVDRSLTKTGTLVKYQDIFGAQKKKFEPFRKIKFQNQSVIKVAVQPLNPSELPKLLQGLRKVNKYYPMADTKVEQSGEHVLHGSGELYLDSILHDLRKVFADQMEIKVSDPFVELRQTILDTSAMKCVARTKNGKNSMGMIAEPLDKGLDWDIEKQIIQISSTQNIKKMMVMNNNKDSGDYGQDYEEEKLPKIQAKQYLINNYDWDELTADGLWAFGPQMQSPNMVVDYTLPSQTDTQALDSVRDSIIQGFIWATKEGPLCEQPIRNVKFKLIDVELSSTAIFRGGGQIIPAARRACYSSLLMAQPRMMEPILIAQIQCPNDCISTIHQILIRRRGHFISEQPNPGSPLFILQAILPAIDSFGFQTDIRSITAGQAFVTSVFDHWQMAPGDPLDYTIQLTPLEPSPPPHLAREYMLKTRRRKGLRDELSVVKFFDSEEDMLQAQMIFEKDLAGGVRS